MLDDDYENYGSIPFPVRMYIDITSPRATPPHFPRIDRLPLHDEGQTVARLDYNHERSFVRIIWTIRGDLRQVLRTNIDKFTFLQLQRSIILCFLTVELFRRIIKQEIYVEKKFQAVAFGKSFCIHLWKPARDFERKTNEILVNSYSKF